MSLKKMSLKKKYTVDQYYMYRFVKQCIHSGTHSIDSDRLINLFKDVDDDSKKEILEILSIGDNIELFQECESLSNFDISYSESKLLCVTSYNSSFRMIQYLLEKGLDPQTNNNYPIRAVVFRHRESDKNTIKAIQLLIEYGADIHFNNDQLLYLACLTENIELVKFFINMGLVVDHYNGIILENVVMSGDIELINIVLDAGANPSNISAIMAAIDMYDVDALELLINRGANINILSPEKLVKIIKSTSFEIIQLLIDAGVDFNSINNYRSADKTFHKLVPILESAGVDSITLSHILFEELCSVKYKI